MGGGWLRCWGTGTAGGRASIDGGGGGGGIRLLFSVTAVGTAPTDCVCCGYI